MKKGNHKLFYKDPQLLITMVNMRRSGETLKTLSLLYRCDWTSIKAQCKKYGIRPIQEVIGIQSIIADVVQKEAKSVWEVVGDEKVNKGRSYKDYLKIQYPHYKHHKYW